MNFIQNIREFFFHTIKYKCMSLIVGMEPPIRKGNETVLSVNPSAVLKLLKQ